MEILPSYRKSRPRERMVGSRFQPEAPKWLQAQWKYAWKSPNELQSSHNFISFTGNRCTAHMVDCIFDWSRLNAMSAMFTEKWTKTLEKGIGIEELYPYYINQGRQSVDRVKFLTRSTCVGQGVSVHAQWKKLVEVALYIAISHHFVYKKSQSLNAFVKAVIKRGVKLTVFMHRSTKTIAKIFAKASSYGNVTNLELKCEAKG